MAWTALVVALLPAGLLVLSAGSAQALATAVPLGTADSFAVLGGQTVTNTGPSTITGDLGVSPGSAIVGFPPGIISGAFHAADAVALQAQSDLVTAYNNAAGQAQDASLATELGGQTLVPGVYGNPISLEITGTLTLDGQGANDGVWVFQSPSTLITASASSINLINGAQACNVFWQVGSSATLGTGSNFVGNILASASITATTGATIQGRLLARDGSVTLDTNTITRVSCEAPPTSTETSTETSTVTETSVTESTMTETPATTSTGGGVLGTGQVTAVPVGSVDTGDGSVGHRNMLDALAAVIFDGLAGFAGGSQTAPCLR